MKLMHGDCLELMAQIPDGSVDMVLCDLPYGTTACKWDSVIPFEPLWAHYKRVIKRNGAIVLTASQPFTSALVMSNIDMFKYQWVWEKERPSNFFAAKFMPLNNTEDVLVFSDGGCNNGAKNPMCYYPQGLIEIDRTARNSKPGERLEQSIKPASKMGVCITKHPPGTPRKPLSSIKTPIRFTPPKSP